jgi:hypothetical protein
MQMTSPAMRATAAALALALAGGLPATAQAPRDDRPDFAMLDADGDGRLTMDEMRTARSAAVADRFEAIDADGDGAVTLREMQDAPAARFAARMLERFDTDGDGAISRAELMQGAEARREARGGAMFGRLDVDADGAISEEEFAAMRPGGGIGAGPRHGARRGRMAPGRGPGRE